MPLLNKRHTVNPPQELYRDTVVKTWVKWLQFESPFNRWRSNKIKLQRLKEKAAADTGCKPVTKATQWQQKHLRERGSKVLRSSNSILVLSDSPLSMSAPPETRSLRPTRSQDDGDDADETVLCLQPDLPLAKKKHCSPSIQAGNRCVKSSWSAALLHPN